MKFKWYANECNINGFTLVVYNGVFSSFRWKGHDRYACMWIVKKDGMTVKEGTATCFDVAKIRAESVILNMVKNRKSRKEGWESYDIADDGFRCNARFNVFGKAGAK